MNMPKAMTSFDNKPVTSTTPYQMQDAICHGALVCVELGNHVASVREPNSDNMCYIFWDEGAQASMPYESEALAREALAMYIANL